MADGKDIVARAGTTELYQVRYVLKSMANGDDQSQAFPWMIQHVEDVAARVQSDAATIAALREQLAEARGEPDRIAAWLRAEAQTCDCFAREEGECACGARDSDPGERSNKRAYLEDIADAIEKRNNGQ